jgi:PIN domain nuclease of toxin-antitoxin system
VIILDTHAWVWWASGSKRLPARVRRQLEREHRLGVCAISCWEVAMLVEKGRLRFDRAVSTWIDQALQLPSVELLPLDPAICVGAAALAPFGGDPADQMIVATARHWRASLASADQRITESGLISVLW